MNLTASFTTFYKYDENRVVSGKQVSGWVNYKTPTSVLEPLRGYAVNFGTSTTPVTVDVTGVVNNGNITIPLYNNNNTYTKGFNLVGNPYPSSIDWYAATGWTKTNIDDALYFFKASSTEQYNGEYQTLIGGISSDGIVSRIIPSMQGFFVHVTDGNYPVNGSLGMTNKVRVTNLSQEFTKGGETKGPSLLRFTAEFSDYSTNRDYSVVYFDPKATVEFNGQTDAYKMMNTDKNVPNIYEVSPLGTNTSIKAIPYGVDTTYNIPLGLKVLRGGQIIIKIRDIEGDFTNMTKISIYDKEKNIEQDLLKGQQYTIQVNPGEYKDRLFLRFSNKATFTFTTDVNEEVISDDFKIYSANGILKTEFNKEGVLNIYDVFGQPLFITEIGYAGYYEFTPSMKNGVYIATFVTGSIRTSKKLYFKN
jgi:fibronectin-binding autotransporter adhesin